MSAVSSQFRGGARLAGGILGYPLDQLNEEVAFVAYHFKWSHEDIMSLEHRDRRQWVEQISEINERMNAE